MLYLIAPNSFATAPNAEIAQLLVSAGYRIVDKATFDAHVRQLAEPEQAEPEEGPPRFDDHGFDAQPPGQK